MTLNYCQTFGNIRFRDYRQYILSRFSRIAPTHVATLLLITPLCLYLNSHAALLASRSFVVPAGTAIRVWLANLFLVQVYHPTIEYEQMYNAPAWSVACEVVFYLSFPFLICVLQRYAKSAARLFTLAGLIWVTEVIAVFVAIQLLRNHGGQVDERTFDFVVVRCPFIRIAEFLIGCCIGLVFVRGYSAQIPRIRSSNGWLWVSLVLLGICFGALAAMPHFKLTNGLLAITPASGVAILALAMDGHVLQRFLQSKWMILLGESSYALYLLQWTAILYFRQSQFAGMSLILLLTLLCGCVAGSVLLHLYLEVPVCRFVRRWLTTPRAPRQPQGEPGVPPSQPYRVFTPIADAIQPLRR